jgi:HAD superfamily hydrolase (TIGR01509 family)
VQAVLFDLDGTLVDTETQTDQAVSVVAARHGVAGFSLPPGDTRGRTWTHIAGTTRMLTGIDVPAATLAEEMLSYWDEIAQMAQPLPGATAAIRAAAAVGLQLAVVSSSPRAVINRFVDRLEVGECIGPGARIGGDCVSRGKPDPEGFLLAARTLGADPSATLVFEDSQAGLLAARAAGMRSMFVTYCASDIAASTSLATARCTDYKHLPSRFWPDLRAGLIDLDQRSFV